MDTAVRRIAAFSFLALVMSLLSTAEAPTHARAASTWNAETFADVALPPDIGQSELQVYVPQTRHTLRGSMLDYWRANGAASVYGYPISEPFASADGHYSQAFENGVFQYHPEYLYTEEPIMRLMPIGQEALKSRLDAFRRDGRRGFGGGDRRHALWRPLAPDTRAVQRTLERGGVYIEQTGYTITGEFLSWYRFHEGGYYLGPPLSRPLAERGMTVQYFEGALLLRDVAGNVRLAPLARELAPRLGIDTTPVQRNGLPIFDERLFWLRDNPNPLGDPYAPGRKWIRISISEQRLWAYQGDTLITTTLVSTGAAPNLTELGVFRVRLKYLKQDMRGFTNATGEVVGFGSQAPAGGVLAYEVRDVPHVMYFNMDAEALHGAYWHNAFGTPRSHGCVNLPLDMAAFLYGWAPLGTMVWVHP